MIFPDKHNSIREHTWTDEHGFHCKATMDHGGCIMEKPPGGERWEALGASQSAGLEMLRLREQRDALADALLRTTISYPDNPTAGTHYAECTHGLRGQAPDDDRCSSVCKTVRAALKLAGRLPS